MRNLWTIFRRELGAYFNSPIAVIFTVAFIVFNNGLFMLSFFQAGRADMRAFFANLPLLLSFFVPAISMRLWAEERRSSTFELLLTLPMRPHELVLGKYLASFAFFAFVLATTFTIPAMLMWTGRTDFGPIIGGYAGAALLGALFLAIGIFISGLSKDQITAFILSVLANYFIFLAGTEGMAMALDGIVPGFGTFAKRYIGTAGHLTSFARGVLDVRDAVYFVWVIAALLFLNGLSLEGRYRPRAKIVYSAAVGVSLVSLVLVNWLLSDLAMGRFDLTEGKIYTTSDVSLKILKDLKVPVRAKLYITPQDRMPTLLKSLEEELTDKFEELRIASGNKFQYTRIHPEIEFEKDPEARDRFDELGVAAFQVESVQRDEVGVKLIYSTLVLEYKEKPREIFPRLLPQGLGDFEYQLLSRIYKMTLDERPVVAVFAPVKKLALSPELEKLLGEAGGGASFSDVEDTYKTALLLVRNNGYDTRRIAISKSDPIPARTRTLLVLNPGTLSEEQIDSIRKYVEEGGTAVVAAHGFEYSYQRASDGLEAQPEKQSLDINKLLEKWGVKIGEDILLDENSDVIQLTTGQMIGPFAVQIPVKLPNQILVDESQVNRDVPLVSRIPRFLFLWGSAVDVSPDAVKEKGLKSTVLFTSSAKSWRVPYSGGPLSADAMKFPKTGSKGNFSLGVTLEKEGPDAKFGKLVVLGNAKVFTDDLIRSPGNLNLYANLVDGLTLGEDLVKIRSKTVGERMMRRLSTAEKFWLRIFTVFLVPFLVLGFAGIRVFIRKKEKELYVTAHRA